MTDSISVLVAELCSGRASVASASKVLAERGKGRSERRSQFTRAALAAGVPVATISQALGHSGGRHE
ncbi:MAG: hypothetical protein KIS61_09375 [Candidatus Eremiobacteraeota bacterium]|nr:hypothetical protein [Candidatus Eremiobacteraeota bacterium]